MKLKRRSNNNKYYDRKYPKEQAVEDQAGYVKNYEKKFGKTPSAAIIARDLVKSVNTVKVHRRIIEENK